MVTPVDPRRPLLWPALVEELARSAAEPATLYMVGGMVRDALLGRPVHDIDLATPGDGLEAARLLADALGGAYFAVDRERRTGRVILDGAAVSTIDVASFRGEGLLGDLLGRDFTINAMAVRLDAPQALYDPLGGQRDLFDERLIRQCTPTSISSDPIRALRAVRQSLQFRLALEPATKLAVRTAASALLGAHGQLDQPERARDELFRMLAGPQPAPALRLLSALGLLPALCPFPLPPAAELEQRIGLVQTLGDIFTVISPHRTDNSAAQLMLGVAVMVLDRFRRQLQEHLSRELVDGRTVAALALLTALTPSAVLSAGERWAAYLRLSNAEARTMSALQKALATVPRRPPVDARAAHRYYREVGEAGVTGVLVMLAEELHAGIAPEAWGDVLEHVASPLLEAFFRRHQEIVSPPPLLDGDDLMQALGIQPGPQVGSLLERLLEEQAAGTVRTRREALELAERLASGTA